MTISSLVIFLTILFALVVIHELGHFLAAKFFKIRVDEFAFGFPPRLLTKKIGDTTYSFNLIPLGGYVRIFGENGLDEEEIKKISTEDKKKLFSSKSALQRIIVLSGGVVFNILGAIILFSIAFMFGSNIFLDQSEVATVPYTDRKMILVDVNIKSSLAGTDISLGDQIVKMQSEDQILERENLDSYKASEFVQAHNNSQIQIYFKDKTGEVKQINAIAKPGIVEGKKVLGVGFQNSSFKKYGFFEAISQSVKTTFEQLKQIFIGLWQMLNDLIFKNAKVEENISGPIGLAMMTTKVSEKGIDQILIFAAMLSLSLAAFNILPIPALDGGRIIFVLAEIVTGKKVKATTEQLFHGLGFLLLLGLMIFVTYFDIIKAIA